MNDKVLGKVSQFSSYMSELNLYHMIFFKDFDCFFWLNKMVYGDFELELFWHMFWIFIKFYPSRFIDYDKENNKWMNKFVFW